MTRAVALVAAVLLLCAALPAQNRQEIEVSQPSFPDAPSSQLGTSHASPNPSWVQTDPDGNYVPLTSREKFDVFTRRSYSPWTFVGAAWDAAVSQATAGHEEYGGGMQGYGKRFGASVADNESGVFFGYYLLPTLLHQDPRYFRRPDLPFIRRGFYAASRVLLTRTDSGGTTVNLSYLGGSLAASAVANSYYPFNERGVSNTMLRFASGMMSDAGMNAWHEFWPDIKSRLTRTKAYRRIERSKLGKEVEQKVEQHSR